MLRRGWPRRVAHFSGEDLLIYADGEATPKVARAIEEHLKSCWGCRGQLHAIEDAVSGLVKARAALLNTPAAAPPKNWREFEPRLDEIAARGEKPLLFAWLNRRRTLQASSAILALAAVLWLALPTPTVSAKEALSRAGDAEAKLARQVSGPVVYQKVHLRRTAPRASAEEATLEVWDDAAHGRIERRGEDRLWREFDRALAANHLDGKPLVSARTFSSWRSAVRVKDESAERTSLLSGAPAVRVHTSASGPYLESQIVEGELLLGATDWLPISQTWRVQGQDRIWQYELQAVTQPVLARKSLDVPALTALPTLPKPSVSLLPPATPALSAMGDDADLVELEARYILHRRGDCLAGLIQVQREGKDRTVVRGLAETSRQKVELTAALPRSPLLSVEISTLEELETAVPPASQPEPAGEIQAPPGNREIPAADLLRRRMEGRYGAENAPRRTAELVNEAVGLSRSMRGEAWALRRLAERYGSGATAPLARSARRMLEAMLREHLLRLRAETTKAVAVFEPLWGESPGFAPAVSIAPAVSAFSWGECLELARNVEEIDTLIQDLFTASGRPANEVDPRIRQLQADLERLLSDDQTLEARLALLTAKGDLP